MRRNIGSTTIRTQDKFGLKTRLGPKTNPDRKPDSDQRQIRTENHILTKDNPDRKPDSDKENSDRIISLISLNIYIANNLIPFYFLKVYQILQPLLI